MIDLKSEIVNKQKSINNKIGVYNQVINENSGSIKDIFKDSELNVDIIEEKNGSLTLQFTPKDKNKRGYARYSYDSVVTKKQEILNQTIDTEYVESQLKDFIVELAINSGINIEKINRNNIKEKNNKYNSVLHECKHNIIEFFESNGFKVITYPNLNARMGIQISKEYNFESIGELDELLKNCYSDEVTSITETKLKEFITNVIADNPLNCIKNKHILNELLKNKE